MTLAASGGDINPLAPSNQLHPHTNFPTSQITAMIVKKQEEAHAKIDNAEDSATDDPPPTYSPPEASSSSSHPTVRPTNYTSISQRNGSIKGTWVIDPSLSIPSSVLPPLPEGVSEDARENFFLKTKDGKIEADVTIVPCSLPDSVDEKGKRKKVVLSAKTSDGRVALKLHDASTPSTPRRPISLTTITSDGHILLNLPRSFHGPLLLKFKDGKFRFSEEVQAQITTFSEDKGIRKCFLGEFVAEEWGEDGEEGWAGDEVTAETKDGDIYIWFDDEVGSQEKPKGFFKKVFGI